MFRQLLVRILATAALVALAGCIRSDTAPAHVVVFKHGRIEGDRAAFLRILGRFRELNPDITVIDETLPASTDEQHQFYIINLEGNSRDFDVFALDLIWLPEFARAGWLRDLSHLLPESERRQFFPAAIEAVTVDGHAYGVPWFVDAGLLYYRKDLLARHNFRPPRTWPELVEVARYITGRHPGLYGFLWPGKQDESLVCTALEFIRSGGGELFRDGRPSLDTAANADALRFMRDLIVTSRVTPELVTTANEEAIRQIFGHGDAVFMRNWPYACRAFLRDPGFGRKVGVAPLPAFAGHEGAATLGGWLLGINRSSRNPAGAEKLVRFLTSEETQRELAMAIGYQPARMSSYREACGKDPGSFSCSVFRVLLSARPRPVTPYYMMVTQVLQPEISAAVSGIRSPEAALRAAQKQVVHLMAAER